jgi:transposase
LVYPPVASTLAITKSTVQNPNTLQVPLSSLVDAVFVSIYTEFVLDFSLREQASLLKKSLGKQNDKIRGSGQTACRDQDMLGHKDKVPKVHTAVCLEDLVPPDNFYRELEVKLDLTFVRDLVRDYYSSHMERPSIDPVVFFKLQLIMFFEGIRSERQLMDMVNMRLDHRWYIGYDLDEAIPDHNSLSKIRERYGLEVFQRFFEQMVERCIQAGLVWGKELFFDGTKVQANADIDSLMPRFYVEAKQHLNTLFSQTPEKATSSSKKTPSCEPPARPRGFVTKYKGDRIPDQMPPLLSAHYR